MNRKKITNSHLFCTAVNTVKEGVCVLGDKVADWTQRKEKSLTLEECLKMYQR